MSIATEIQRLQTAKTDVRTSLLKKGIYIPAGTLVSSFSTYIDSENPIPWKSNPSNYLSFFFIENGSIAWDDPNEAGDIQYSKNGGTTWTFFNGSTLSVNAFEEVWFKRNRSDGLGYNSPEDSSRFITTGKFFAGGNILSINNFNETLTQYHFAYFFYQCSGLNIDKSNPLLLPSTTLASYCYSHMFEGCISLKTPPELPATTLLTNCYSHMFRDCTSLTSAPTLPATTLAQSCYAYMFKNCASLRRPPVLIASTLQKYSYREMFNECINLNYIIMLATTHSATGCLQNWVTDVSETGTFIKNASTTTLPTDSVSGIPTGWTVIDA